MSTKTLPIPHADFELDDLDWDSSGDSLPSSASTSPSWSPAQAMRALSLATSPPSTPPSLSRSDYRRTGHRRESLSTAATTISSSNSDLSAWTDGAIDSDDDGAASSTRRERSVAVSAPVTPMQLLVPAGGRKRSLTEVLQLDPEDGATVAMELASWINDQSSPFETDSPCNSPLPRPFPLFKPHGSGSATAILDVRGLPLKASGSTPPAPTKRSYGFIPFSGPVGGAFERNIDETLDTKQQDRVEREGS